MLTLAALLGLGAAATAVRPLAALLASRRPQADVFAGLLEEMTAEEADHAPVAARFPALVPADEQPYRLAA